MKKCKGSLLLELLLTTLLASVILTMLYKLYRIVFQSVEYVKIDNNFQIEKLTALYNIESDAFQIIIPSEIEELYKKYILYKKKSPNRESENKKIKEPTDKNTEKEKKELEKNIQKLNKFIPTIEKTDQKITISWITQRVLFNKEFFSKITYTFLKTKHMAENEPIYTLYRKETPLDATYTLQEEEKEYKLISSLINPEVTFIVPTSHESEIPKELTSPKEKKNDEPNKFLTWKKERKFENRNKTEPLDLENFETFTLIPQTLIIKAEMLAENKKKSTDLFFTINFPSADFAFEVFLNQKPDEQSPAKPARTGTETSFTPSLKQPPLPSSQEALT